MQSTEGRNLCLKFTAYKDQSSVGPNLSLQSIVYDKDQFTLEPSLFNLVYLV